MAFKASNPLLAEAYKSIKGTSYQVKRYADGRSAIFVNGGTESEILAAVDNLSSMKNILQTSAGVAGLAEYAKIQEDDPTYDVVAEYTTMLAAIDAVLAYITNSIPAPRTFDTVQLAPLKTLLDDLSSKIE